MNRIWMTLKREFWEHRFIVVGLPIVLWGVLFIAFFGAGIFCNWVGEGAMFSEEVKTELGEDFSLFDSVSCGFDLSLGHFLGLMAPFLAVSWLVSLYYVLSCLYADRKERSIFFFKSLPISEQFNVLSKLGFGSAGVMAFGIAIGWTLALVLLVFGLVGFSDVEFNLVSFLKFLIAPFIAVLVGAFWGAPLFAYLALASAAAKRSPWLLAVIPLLAIAFLELAFFKDVRAVSFLLDHMPMDVLPYFVSGSAGELIHHFFIDQGQQMLLGLVLAVAFVYIAVWCRNNKFEI